MPNDPIEEAPAVPPTPARSPSAPAPARSGTPGWYPNMLASVADMVSTGRVRAVEAVNQELAATDWAVGKEPLVREASAGRGTRVVLRLSSDPTEQFPGMMGYSPRNLRYMKQFAETWPDFAMLQAPPAALPWYHQIALLEKLSDPENRLWCAAAAVEHGWSRNVLVHQIETRLHERSGQAVRNFKAVLPAADSGLMRQTRKDRHNEGELESRLIGHVGQFLLEHGQGFAFVGRQVRMVVGGDEFHCRLFRSGDYSETA